MRTLFQRYFWFMVGVVINSFGIALITKADLGTSPISSISYVLSLKLPPTLGQFTFLVNMIFIMVQLILLKKDFEPIQFLQIGVNIIFSACIDGSMRLLGMFAPEDFLIKFLSLLFGCVVLGIGISIEVAPDVIVVPGEGIVRAIASVTGKEFGSVKVIFDASLVTTAVILSLIFWGGLIGVGIGTVVSAMVVGPVVNQINGRIPLISHIRSLKKETGA